MLKQLMLSKKIEQARKVLNEYTEEETKIKTRSEELEKSIEEAETEEEINAVDEETEKLEKEKEELQEKKNKLEGEIKELEGELDQLNSKEPENKKRNRGVDDMEIREGIKRYVQSKGQDRAGFTSVEGGALIPEELLKPKDALEDELDLTKIIGEVTVHSGSGKYPVIKKSGSKMASVAELSKNPELAKPVITEVPYDIETYRGYIPVSQEVIDDADYDVAGMISEEISDQDLNTKNHAIATVLKSANAKAVTGIDGLKTLFNTGIKKVYRTKAILSASLFNELDLTKDKNGRYLLQDDIKSSSGKKLFGYEVIVLDDDVIGINAGDLVGFIGDPKEFAKLFNRKKTSVKWVDHEVYGQLLAGFVRFDVQKVDSEAGFYVTYTPEPAV
ncbi:phage major capsid protein [Senegalia massiliensis]|uniref:phage major capsid protein n=1 Tax=Senegalia massiliensis TaxID=1720316 RepID=UPI0010301885|nr:phage major capsid protein [Senegalia massiliensis]